MADPAPKTRGILGLFVRHATLANLLFMVMVVAGLLAAPRMRAQFFPDNIEPEINVAVRWDGAGAEDVDNAIVAVLEPALMAVEGATTVSSRATEGMARILITFETGWDMARASADVETAIDGAGTLPEDAEDPAITRAAWRDRVVDVVITGPVSLDLLGRYADDLTNRLYAVGINRLTLTGIAAPGVVAEVSMADLERHDLTLAQVAGVVTAASSALPAGDVASGAARVRTGTEARDPAAIAALAIKAQPDGTVLTVGDVARVTDEGAGREQAWFVDGNPAVVLSVQRAASGDAIAMQATVGTVIDQMQPSLPEGVTLTMIRARAEIIADRLQLLLDNALVGLGLVLALLFLFLNARTAFWVAAGIPASLLAAIAFMYATGMTLNMISLFALILTLGIVVDDAIVVGEHADYRARTLREPGMIAAENAARRMAAPVFSSTATTIIAFAGMLAIGGRFGNTVGDIPKVVMLVLAASLIECLLVLPAHMGHALTGAARAHWYDAPSRAVNRGLDWLIMRALRPMMGWVWRLRYPVIAGTMALLMWSVAALMSGAVQWRFFSPPEQGSITGNFAMLPGATRDDTRRVMMAAGRAVQDLGARYADEYGINPITHASVLVGGNTGRPLPGAETKDADQLGAIQIEMIDPDLRPYTGPQFVQALQEAMPADPMLETVSFRSFGFGPADDAISVRLSGAQSQVLKDAAEALKARLAAFSEVSALEDSMAYDKPELDLALTAQGRALGFTTEALARDLRQRLGGIEAATFPVGTRSGTITVTLPDDERRGDFLETMRMRSAGGQWVPLADIVAVTERAGFSTIRREDGVRQITVTGDLADDDPDRAAAVMARLEQVILPDIAAQFGVAYDLTGLAEQERAFLADAMLGFAVALLCIYGVLALVFGSWARPVAVMAVIPFGLIGAVWGHAVWQLPLSMFSIVGLIGMSGIIINDSIVLISTIDDYGRRRGLREAVIDAVANRLRPVFLTTATTVLGLAPLLYERSSQALFLKPTVVTLAYGLGFGMVIVLVVVPAALGVGQDLGRARRAFGRGLRARALRRPLMAGAGVAGAGFAVALLPLAAQGVLPAWWPVPAGTAQAAAWYGAAVLGGLVVAAALAARGRAGGARRG